MDNNLEIHTGWHRLRISKMPGSGFVMACILDETKHGGWGGLSVSAEDTHCRVCSSGRTYWFGSAGFDMTPEQARQVDEFIHGSTRLGR